MLSDLEKRGVCCGCCFEYSKKRGALVQFSGCLLCSLSMAAMLSGVIRKSKVVGFSSDVCAYKFET
jgi:hypothetical protein